jgi:hypothetical protein
MGLPGRHLRLHLENTQHCVINQILFSTDMNTDTILANAADGGSPFAILQPDGFLVPFGEFPHKQGLQLFDRAAAEEIVKAHNSALSKLTRLVTGGSYPVYVGHPDLPGSKDTDKRAYGWIENMRVTDEGLHLSAKWSDAGRELVENAHFKFYSPLWWTRKVKGGIRPIALKSMGLTNDPNIPVPALANEAEGEEVISDQSSVISEESQSEDETKEPIENMKPEILAALGLDEGATPESVLAKITEIQAAANEAEARISEWQTAVANANAEIARFETELAAANQSASEATAALAAANEKVEEIEANLAIAANAAVQAAVTAGRITPAEAEAKASEILAANDFDVALKELAKAPARFKTASTTGDLGEAKSRLVVAANDESAAKRNERAVLVANEYANTNPALSEGERKRIAWQRAQKKHPELFAKKDSSGSAA